MVNFGKSCQNKRNTVLEPLLPGHQATLIQVQLDIFSNRIYIQSHCNKSMGYSSHGMKKDSGSDSPSTSSSAGLGLSLSGHSA